MSLPKILRNYPGNRNIQGMLERIINEIPPHDVYVEQFAGSAAVFRRKKEAIVNCLLEIDPLVADALKSMRFKNTWVLNRDVLNDFDWKSYMFGGLVTFVFADPPWPIEARLGGARIYRHEMTMEQHESYLTDIVLKCPHNMAVCSNKNSLYESLLKDWRKIEVQVNYHSKPATEVMYFNYPEPKELHEYTYLGADAWDRQRIKRKIRLMDQRLKKLPPLERNALIKHIKDNF